MNRMPAISSEVPIGKRINGDEMLSFMPTTGGRLAHLVPKSGSAHLTARGRAFPQTLSGGSPENGSPAPPVAAQHTDSRSRCERKAAVCSFDLRPIDAAFGHGAPIKSTLA